MRHLFEREKKKKAFKDKDVIVKVPNYFFPSRSRIFPGRWRLAVLAVKMTNSKSFADNKSENIAVNIYLCIILTWQWHTLHSAAPTSLVRIIKLRNLFM